MNPPPAGRRTSIRSVAAPPGLAPPDPHRPLRGRIRRFAARLGAAVRAAHSAAVPF